MRKLWALVKKDWRMNRATVVGLVIMNAVAYALGLGAYWWDKYTFVVSTPHRRGISTAPIATPVGYWLSSDIRLSAEMGLLFVVLAAAVFGGAAFAMERRERSADFLAMLPAKRSRIIASKLLVSFVVLGSFLAIETSVLFGTDLLRSWETSHELLEATFVFAAAGMAVFAIAWLLSTFLSSAAIAASVAILLAICGSFLFNVICGPFITKGEASEIATCAAVIFVLIGNMYYLRRVAP